MIKINKYNKTSNVTIKELTKIVVNLKLDTETRL